MKKDRILWDAMGMLGEDLLAEADGYGAVQRKKTGTRIAVLAAAALLAVSCIGWAAKTWIFAPGYGLVGIDMLNGKTVYMAADAVQVGMVELEAVILTEDRENPENNILTLWMYRREENAYPVGETDIRLPEIHFKAMVNGVLYDKDSGTWGEWGYQYIRLSPAEMPGLLEGECTVQLQYPEGEAELLLLPVDGNDVCRNVLEDGSTMALLPLTENLYAGNFVNPAWQKTLERLDPGYISATVHFTTMTGTGETGWISGGVNLNGYAYAGSLIAPWEHHGQGIVSMTLDWVEVYLNPSNQETYVFPMPDEGETHICDILLWEDFGFTCRLTGITRTEEGLEYVLSHDAEDLSITPVKVSLHTTGIGSNVYGESAACDMAGNILNRNSSWGTATELPPPGAEMTIRLYGITFRYTSPDGEPMTTFVFE
ncbi:MAG: hypothetical protein IJ480_00675 [Clostridia bacterium]|nr:hypothetical protein [Clostridia bacterium]